MKPWPSRTSRNAASSRGISGSYSARTSTRGIVCTRGHFSLSHPPIDQIRQQGDDAYDDRVLDIAEAVIKAAIARTEPVAGACKGEGPHGGTCEREQRVRKQPHLEDPGRDRDEGADDRRYPAEEDGGVPPAVEPRLGAIEPLGREVEPATVAFEQGPSSVAADRPADERAHEIAERAREGERDIGAGAVADPASEERHALAGRGDPRSDRSGIEHHELARRREEGVDRHQPEDGVDAVIRHRGGEARRDAREEHRADTSDACERAMRTAPRASSCRRSSSPARPPGSGRSAPAAGRSRPARSLAPAPQPAAPYGVSPPPPRSGAGSARPRLPRASSGRWPSRTRRGSS